MRLNNGYTHRGRHSIDIGCFGAIRTWNCYRCGPIEGTPGDRMLSGCGTYEPASYAQVCPECGEYDSCQDDTPRWSFSSHSRRKITLKHNPATSAVAL